MLNGLARFWDENRKQWDRRLAGPDVPVAADGRDARPTVRRVVSPTIVQVHLA